MSHIRWILALLLIVVLALTGCSQLEAPLLPSVTTPISSSLATATTLSPTPTVLETITSLPIVTVVSPVQQATYTVLSGSMSTSSITTDKSKVLGVVPFHQWLAVPLKLTGIKTVKCSVALVPSSYVTDGYSVLNSNNQADYFITFSSQVVDLTAGVSTLFTIQAETTSPTAADEEAWIEIKPMAEPAEGASISEALVIRLLLTKEP